MSIEPEDSLFEQALRDDLPSTDAEARLRRRLLAAGVALGHGVATTTAAASGAAGTSAAGTGFFAQALGLSWGMKLGAVAAVAIPTLGLVIEGRSVAPPKAARPAASAVVSAPASSAASPAALDVVAAPAAVELPTSVAASSARAVARREASRSPTLADDRPAAPPAPSQSDFEAAPEAPTAAVAARSTLGDETRLLDGAFAALSAGDRARAAQLIGEHEARYPRGLLSKERERAKTRLTELSRGP
ncbi:MAG TPA: hypothetical protein VEQ59_23835 [Polyangiaceae bacterium]|nr:hypothetical protein [Polyangiaceae bacterium]